MEFNSREPLQPERGPKEGCGRSERVRALPNPINHGSSEHVHSQRCDGNCRYRSRSTIHLICPHINNACGIVNSLNNTTSSFLTWIHRNFPTYCRSLSARSSRISPSLPRFEIRFRLEASLFLRDEVYLKAKAMTRHVLLPLLHHPLVNLLQNPHS